MGNLKFKVISYRKLQEIMRAGALGCELRISGKLPSERSKSWRFAEGYLKKAGESRKEVNRAEAIGLTKTGIIGVKVAIMAPDAKIYDRVEVNDELFKKINQPDEVEEIEEKPEKKTIKKKVEKKSIKKKRKEVKVKEEISEEK
jgi:small subunit ribosomal protein S3